MTTPIRSTNPNITRIEATTVRATPTGVGGRFRQALSDSAGVVLSGLEAVAGAIPGGSIVTAAVRGAGGSGGGVAGASSALTGSGSGSSGESVEAPAAEAATGSVESALAQSADQNMYFLKIQEQLQSENRRYSALSNVLKARHETVKNAIGNIR